MISRRLRLPASLALSVLGLGVSNCSEPNPQSDSGVTTCESACAAQHSGPAPDCIPATEADSATACVPVADASGGGGLCSIAPVVMTSTGSCCCAPLI